jgi:hypothetical protein
MVEPIFNAAAGRVAEEVGARRPVRLGGLVERECPGEIDLERATPAEKARLELPIIVI